MFGFIAPRLDEVEPQEKERFQAVYCGVCRALGRQCGQRCRLTLSYDMAFLALLLGSMYEPAEEQSEGRCLPHPVKARPYLMSECIDYAADMNVALVYYKCLDDWNDERSVRGRTGVAALEKPYRGVQERNPRVCAAIEQYLGAIDELERAAGGDAARKGRAGGGAVGAGAGSDAKAAASGADAAPTADAEAQKRAREERDAFLREEARNPDAAANLFGLLLGEVFAWRDDFWAEDLRRFGARLGKFVYLMDAVVDYEDDAKSGSYNPLVLSGEGPEDMKADLEMLAAGAADAFERLPLEQDMHLLRSVLYSGMWQQYYAKEEKQQKQQEKKEQKEKRRG